MKTSTTLIWLSLVVTLLVGVADPCRPLLPGLVPLAGPQPFPPRQEHQKGDTLNRATSINLVTWEDQGRPWSVWEFAGVAWNVDIAEALPVTAGVR